jgi:hypothetical protein
MKELHALLQLVMIAANKSNIKGAQKHFADLKKLNVTEPMLREQIEEVEKQLKMAGSAYYESGYAGHDGRSWRLQARWKAP